VESNAIIGLGIVFFLRLSFSSSSSVHTPYIRTVGVTPKYLVHTTSYRTLRWPPVIPSRSCDPRPPSQLPTPTRLTTTRASLFPLCPSTRSSLALQHRAILPDELLSLFSVAANPAIPSGSRCLSLLLPLPSYPIPFPTAPATAAQTTPPAFPAICLGGTLETRSISSLANQTIKSTRRPTGTCRSRSSSIRSSGTSCLEGRARTRLLGRRGSTLRPARCPSRRIRTRISEAWHIGEDIAMPAVLSAPSTRRDVFGGERTQLRSSTLLFLW